MIEDCGKLVLRLGIGGLVIALIGAGKYSIESKR